MNQRERVLASCVAGVIVAYGGFTLVKSQVYEPGKELAADIQEELACREELQVRLNGAAKTIQAWQRQTGQTLDGEWFAAHQTFREDVSLLLKRNNLTEDLKINKYREHIDKDGSREGFVELPLSVRVNGKLGDLGNFLKDFFQRPYVVRLDKLELTAEQTSKSKKRRGGRTEPKLGISMTLSTLVLPNVKGVDHPMFDLAAFNNPDPDVELVMVTPRRLWQEQMDRYGEIVEKDPFTNYEPPSPPPPPPPVTQKEPQQEKTDDPPPPPPPPLDPRPKAHKLVLNGVGWLDDGPIAYVTNTDAPGDPPDGYRLNDNVDDGRLVLILPEGIAVRVTPKGASRQPAKDYFYPLGGTFRDREEINPSEHPSIARQLQVVLKQ